MWNKEESIVDWRGSTQKKIKYTPAENNICSIRLEITKYFTNVGYKFDSIEVFGLNPLNLFETLKTIPGVSLGSKNFCTALYGKNPEQRKLFIKTFIEHLSLQNSKMGNEIYEYCDLVHANQIYFEYCCQLISNDKFVEAKNGVLELQTQKYFHPIWKLSNFLFENATDSNYYVEWGYQLLKQISEDNIFYGEAQLSMFEIMSQQPIENNKDYAIIKEKFITAIPINDETAKRLYKSLCGNKEFPKIDNLTPTPELLCQLALEIKTMNERLASQDQKIKELTTENNELKGETRVKIKFF